MAEARSTQRDALRRRLRSVQNGQCVGRIRAAAPVMVREQTGGVPVFAEAEQDLVEWSNSTQGIRILDSGTGCTVFRRNDMDSLGGDRHMLKPGFCRHRAVSLRVVRWQAAFVAEPDLPQRPVRIGSTQRGINRGRGAASGEDEHETATRRDGVDGRVKNPAIRFLVQRRDIGHRVPTRGIGIQIAVVGAAHSFFTACPPNSLRIAESSLSENESLSRERRRSISDWVMIGAGTSRSMASLTVQRPSPESAT